MTDNDIIKALTEWSERGMTFFNVGMSEFARHILAFINRQKAEIERLKEKTIKCGLPLLGLQTKEEIEEYFDSIMLQVKDAIDEVKKEMTEGN